MPRDEYNLTMSILQDIILGLSQGLTEFIPVSSSGHLVLLQRIFSGSSEHLFIEFINIGTVLALLVYFRKRIIGIIRDIIVHKNIALARNLIITSIPAGLVGFLLSDFIEETPFFGSSVVVAITLASVGVVMVVLERLPKAAARKDGEALEPWRALVIGGTQVLSLIPGVSRSGSTIIAGRLMGLNAEAAAEYSFLASLPIMLGVTAKLFLQADDRAYFMEHWQMLAVSNLVAFVAGILAIGFLMNYLSRHSLAVFGWYRIVLAAIVAVVLLVQ